MANRQDGDDGAFPINGKGGKKERKIVGEANPNSRAANWLREAAAKPPMKQVVDDPYEGVIPDEEETEDEASNEEHEETVGGVIDAALQGIGDYVASLENTTLELYKQVQSLEKKLSDLQAIVLSMQNQRGFNFTTPNYNIPAVPDFNQQPYDPNVVRPTITTPNTAPPPFDKPTRMVTNQMDKE